MEAVIPVELAIPTERTSSIHEEENTRSIQAHLDLLEEKRAKALIRQEAYKCMTERFYNKRVKGRACKVGEMVLRKNDASRQEAGGKLGPNWEGPYRVVEARRNGSYVLETMEGDQLPRTWNMQNLRKFHF
ncbi:hypothetical protein LXL04_032326 [Taraxacum kok-saghyz]